jgi:ABC-type antimicrobial peptide transport system permease subunit
MVSRQAGLVIAIGLGVGLAGALTLTRVLGALLFGVGPIDPPTIAGAAGLLAVVAMVASWVPARRAASLDPARALRAD